MEKNLVNKKTRKAPPLRKAGNYLPVGSVNIPLSPDALPNDVIDDFVIEGLVEDVGPGKALPADIAPLEAVEVPPEEEAATQPRPPPRSWTFHRSTCGKWVPYPF